MADTRLKKKASDVIAEECQAGVHREFPSEWLDKTLEEVFEAATRGDRSARKARKLLNDPRFKK